MALQHRGYLRKKVENIVSHPKQATLMEYDPLQETEPI